MTRAYVSLGMRVLILSKCPPEDAARRAIRHVKSIQSTPIKNVLSWYAQFTKRRVKNKGGAHTFKIGCVMLKDSISPYEDYAHDFFALADNRFIDHASALS